MLIANQRPIGKERVTIATSQIPFKDLFDTLPDLVYSIDHSFFVLYINATASGLYGYAPEELVGKPAASFIHPDDFHVLKRSLIETIQEKRQHERGVRFRVIGKDGRTHWVERNSRMIFDDQGNLMGETGVLRNIEDQVQIEETLRDVKNDLEKRVTERTEALREANEKLLKENEERKRIEKDLRESEKRFRELADFLPQPVYEMDMKGKIKYMSHVGYEMAGYTKEELKEIGYFEKIIHPDDRERFHQNMGLLISGKKAPPSEYTLISKQGALIPLNLYVAAIVKQGKVSGLRGIAVDLRIRKKEEKELVQYEKMTALGNLVAGVAHEINTPLGIGITASTFLEDSTVKYLIKLNAGDATEADTRKFADIVSEASSLIYSNLKRAADQVNSFKTVAVDQASGEFRSFGIKNYINDVLLSLRPKYKRTGHHISLNCPEDLEIYSSPGAFSQIITNLIINSLDHGLSDREAGQMVIDIKRDGQSLLFHYADNGKGMKKETSERIFEPFYTTSKKNGGTGLGMHIVHTIVTQTLKGTIECHSTEGIGTEFLMQVPMMEYP
jgi:PAS domain S-box-containing protein